MANLPHDAAKRISKSRQGRPFVPNLVYSAVGLPPGLSMDTAGRVMGTISGAAAGDYNVTVLVADALGGSGNSDSFVWHVNASTLDFSNLKDGSIGLTWIELYHVNVLGAPKTYLWAPVDLVDDGDYYGGFKEARVIGFGDITRGLSDERGNYESSEFSFVVSDTDRQIRTLLDSAKGKFFQNRMIIIRIIDDESRRQKVTPFVLVRGIVRDWKPRGPLHFEFTGRDFLASSLGAGNLEKNVPFRKLTRVDFPNIPAASEGLPVPILYGNLSDKKERTVTVQSNLINSQLEATVFGAPGSSTHIYTLTAVGAPVDGFGTVCPDPQNPAQDNDHRQEFAQSQCIVTNAPSVEEMQADPTRYIELRWGNVGSGQQALWWGGPSDASYEGRLVCSRIYGRQVGSQPQQLLMGFGRQYALNKWNDTGIASRAPSSQPPGVNNAVFEGDPTAPGTQIKLDQGSGVVPTIHVGEEIIGGTTWQAFVVCGHAVKGIDEWYCGGVRQAASTEGANASFLIPGYAGYISQKGAATYQDRNGRRYTIIYAKGIKADQAVDGTAPITLNVRGIEFAGDGTGLLIEQLADIYKHFVTNFGFQAWESGPWLNAPVWEQGFDPVDQVKAQIDNTSFDTMRAVHANRVAGGYPGAIMFGAPGDGAMNLRDALARLNLSCDCQSGFNRHSQFFVSIFDDRISVLDGAQLYTQKFDILQANFNLEPEIDKVENSVHYVWARRYATYAPQTSSSGIGPAEWIGIKTIEHAESISLLKETRQGPRLELWGVRDDAVAYDIAQRRLLANKEAPIPVKFTTTLKGLTNEIGDVIAVDHVEGGGANGWVGRPLRIMRQITNPQRYDVRFEAIDVWRLYSTAFVLGDDQPGSPTLLPAFWTLANSAQKLRGYLCDETTGAFSNGEDGKRLR